MPPRSPASLPPWTETPAAVRPMLATSPSGSTDAVVASDRYVFERKLDGMRVLAHVEPASPLPVVGLWSRNGHDKTAQFPEIVRELQRFGAALGTAVLLDGELVAVDAKGEPVTFVELAGRLHERNAGVIARKAAAVPVVLVVFDVLREGRADLRGLTLTDRKARLEKIFHTRGSERLRVSDFSAGDGNRWLDRAVRERWEGLIAKDAASRYDSGRRSPAWIKVKVQRQQEFVVGGYTLPRQTRAHFGALVIGYYEPSGPRHVLRSAGCVGSGFSDDTLEDLHRALAARETPTCPFDPVPATPEPARWVRPDLVVQVRFTEWTPDHVLRHPVFLGLRTDVSPTEVRREGDGNGSVIVPSRAAPPVARSAASTASPGALESGARGTKGGGGVRTSGRAADKAAPWPVDADLDLVVQQLEVLEQARRNGTITLPGGARLEVTNLAKPLWPAAGLTKGALLRHYVRVSPALLPVLADRPLIMKRYPNGVTGKSFYQQRAPDDPPDGVRVEVVEGDEEETPRLIGGQLITLLYMAQLASISQDPWFSRVQSPAVADFVAIDLDPMPGVPFAQVRDVAKAVGEQLHALDVPAFLKTSGSSGLHVYLPLDEGTPYEAGQLFCRIVATIVATRHPKIATVERSVSARGRTVYIDYLQNILGKSLASVYSARANEFAGVSAPLEWRELDEGVHPEDVTLVSAMARFSRTGDLWAGMRGARRVDLRAALERLGKRSGGA